MKFYYSLAIDESTDDTDTAQLLVFVRGIDNNFDASEVGLPTIPE